MPIRILFEIGHKAVRKAKPLDAFTHDWELFVRGSDGKEMNKYVEKIVFNLHESFPNPTRTQRDPPYVLREAGYGGFLLPIDIHFKAGPRDEPKLLSITYDLDITKPQHVVKYNHTFLNPSTEFRYKLLEGGGYLINSEGHEDRSQSESRSRCQVSSTTASTGGKKHKSSKTEEGKPLTVFENLFGPPIPAKQNLPAKHSPATTSTESHKPQKPSSKDRSSEKSSKEKKDKSKSSSSKDANNSKETFSKKSSTDEKNERRDDKRKDKSHGKDRDRSKEKPSKRPISPKSESRSPKRSTSPASHRTTSSNSSRHEPKSDDKSGNGGKKSKKEKRDKSKERDRSTTNDNKKDNKEIKHQTQTSTKQKDERLASNKTLEKLNGSGKRDENTGSNTPKDSTSRDKISNSYRPPYDTKPPSPIDLPSQIKPQTPSDSKKSDKHEKDGSERKHKHKKEKKSKDKDKDKERKKDKDKSSKSKELIDESLTISNHRTSTPTQHSNRISSTKPNSTPQPVQVQPPSQRSSHLSEKSSSDYDMEDDYVARSASPPPPKSDIDTNSSMDHAIAEVPRSIPNDSPKKHAEKSSSNKKEKEPKSTQSSTPNKEDKKRKRKTKVEKIKVESEVNSGGAIGGGGKRKIQSPMVNDEPSAKYSKKDDERSPMPIKKETIKKESIKMERMSPIITSSNKLAPPTPSSSSSESLLSISENQLNSESPSSDKTYIAQLKALQQKIMTLQDNDELQQVVDMIAATGCYEITRNTFDFDLCALDRTTVQRLQERLG